MNDRLTAGSHPPARTDLAPPSAPGEDWLGILGQPTQDAFASAFVAEPRLEAVVIFDPVVGADAIHRFFEAARSLYSHIGFTSEIRSADRVYLEWEGLFAGRPVSGATIISFDQNGRIERIRLYHYPLDQLAAFSTAIHCSLAGLGPSHKPLTLLP